MFDRFTDHARQAMGHSRQEAQRFHHDYIGTEHMLLGLLAVEDSVAIDVFRNLGVKRKKIRKDVEKRVQLGTTMVTMGQLPFTPRGKRVLECALEEAANLGHSYIGTEHVLLGLLREEQGIAAQALKARKVYLSDARDEIRSLVGCGREAAQRALVLAAGHEHHGLFEPVRAALAERGWSRVEVADPGEVARSDLKKLVGDAYLVIGIVDEPTAMIVFALGLCEGADCRVIVLARDPDALPPPLDELPALSSAPDGLTERLDAALRMF